MVWHPIDQRLEVCLLPKQTNKPYRLPQGGFPGPGLQQGLVGIVFQGDGQGAVLKQPVLQFSNLLRGGGEAQLLPARLCQRSCSSLLSR